MPPLPLSDEPYVLPPPESGIWTRVAEAWRRKWLAERRARHQEWQRACEREQEVLQEKDNIVKELCRRFRVVEVAWRRGCFAGIDWGAEYSLTTTSGRWAAVASPAHLTADGTGATTRVLLIQWRQQPGRGSSWISIVGPGLSATRARRPLPQRTLR
eukprot:TRINITY_DN15565_c0_g1_i2.p1 TRINITY_DN15565_c0_g1~~TRINITY_DN15565_c0_g1_i2.p1  ORF type:complete len:183 (+),score=17.26 TRINITY_DN15565_c0_g1_i2:81-551(+)